MTKVVLFIETRGFLFETILAFLLKKVNTEDVVLCSIFYLQSMKVWFSQFHFYSISSKCDIYFEILVKLVYYPNTECVLILQI